MSELIVALDGMAPDQALQVAGDLSHLQPNGLWGFKIGHSLTFAGAEWIAELKTFGKVFVDLKLYDIPNTVENNVGWLSSLNIDLATVHLSMGRSTLEKITDKGVGILGVSLLTSAIPDECKRIYRGSLLKLSSSFSEKLVKRELLGLSVLHKDLHLLDQIDPDRTLLRVCPGIRGSKDNAGDQKRTMTPAEAVSEGANLLVVGRPIVERTDYLNAANLILKEISHKY